MHEVRSLKTSAPALSIRMDVLGHDMLEERCRFGIMVIGRHFTRGRSVSSNSMARRSQSIEVKANVVVEGWRRENRVGQALSLLPRHQNRESTMLFGVTNLDPHQTSSSIAKVIANTIMTASKGKPSDARHQALVVNPSRRSERCSPTNAPQSSLPNFSHTGTLQIIRGCVHMQHYGRQINEPAIGSMR